MPEIGARFWKAFYAAQAANWPLADLAAPGDAQAPAALRGHPAEVHRRHRGVDARRPRPAHGRTRRPRPRDLRAAAITRRSTPRTSSTGAGRRSGSSGSFRTPRRRTSTSLREADRHVGSRSDDGAADRARHPIARRCSTRWRGCRGRSSCSRPTESAPTTTGRCPIDAPGQTISQPLMVAVVVEALELHPGDRALDVGTGSGYQAAVMAACGAHVVSIERIESLATDAAERLQRLDYDVEVIAGDGTLGVPGARALRRHRGRRGSAPSPGRARPAARRGRPPRASRSPTGPAARSSPACGWSTAAGRRSRSGRAGSCP